MENTSTLEIWRPEATLKASRRSEASPCLSVEEVSHTRPPAITGEDHPRPAMAVFQRMFCDSLHSIGRPRSMECPSPPGPRNWGQSSAWRARVDRKKSAAAINRIGFTPTFYRVMVLRRLSGRRQACHRRQDELAMRSAKGPEFAVAAETPAIRFTRSRSSAFHRQRNLPAPRVIAAVGLPDVDVHLYLHRRWRNAQTDENVAHFGGACSGNLPLFDKDVPV